MIRSSNRSSSRVFSRALVFVALGAALLVAVAPAARAQATNTPPGVDHYLVYRVMNPPTLTVPVILGDEFIPSAGYYTYTLDYFMTPVNKNNEGIIDPVTHYTWWRINSVPFGALVYVRNQFTPGQPVRVGMPEYLLNPALKNDPTGGSIPQKNHFKVYDAQGPGPQKIVSLVDQFGPWQAFVDTIAYLANPAQKAFQGQVFPILDPVGHLVIYDIQVQPGPVLPPPVVARDEFGTWQLVLGPQVYLCVPSYKDIITPTKPKTWGDLRKLYR